MAEEVTDTFIKNIILSYGIPTEALTCPGTNFMSNVRNHICKLFAKLHTVRKVMVALCLLLV
jgi:hypothetical protein